MTDNMPQRLETRSASITFPVRDAFPPADPLSVDLLRLMAATNDVRIVQKSLLIVQEKARGGDAVEDAVLEGDLGYFTRIMFGHLHEAGIAFRALNDHHGAALETLATRPEAQRELADLRAVFTSADPKSLRKYIEAVRTPWAFHYKAERFRSALEAHPVDGKIVISEFAGVGRYTVVDDFAKRYMVDIAGSVEEFQRFVSESITAAGTLGRAVDLLLGEVFERRQVAFAVTEGVVRVAEEVLRAANRVRLQRAGQGGDDVRPSD